MRITKDGGSGKVGPLRSPYGAADHGLIKKGTLNPKIAPNTICPSESTAAAKIRSPWTGGKPVKPF